MKQTKKKEKKVIKHSISRQLTFIIMGLVTGTVVLCWFLNTWFLDDYYSIQKEKTMLFGFETINDASATGRLESEEFNLTFERICAEGNLSVIIMTSDMTVVRSSTSDETVMQDQLMHAIFSDENTDSKVLETTEQYVLAKQTDLRLDTEYMILWGTLTDGNIILMRTPLESIRESAQISNQFLLMIGIIAIFIGLLTSYFVSRKITHPLLELSDISKRMSDLDFNAKYVGKGKNEIDALGANMNTLSHTLQHTISELKTANNELLIDNERKSQIDEMRKEFLSNVSHELKTPLALILGYAEGLKECINEDQESREFYCEVIIDEADKMNQMVKKLLTLNQLEFGNDVVMIERFNLTDVIRGVIQSSSILVKQKEIDLSFHTDADIYVWADEFKIEEVITNFVSNAINHCEFDKKIDIKYTLSQGKVRVSVFNTGKQIPTEDLDNIWIRFYKVDKARTREYGGSGIGLSIVKAIMDSFHEKCGASNHTDGVEFWFELSMEEK
ncbi:MAG: sensor histidine kinase [Lachnospiraceae bacterium]